MINQRTSKFICKVMNFTRPQSQRRENNANASWYAAIALRERSFSPEYSLNKVFYIVNWLISPYGALLNELWVREKLSPHPFARMPVAEAGQIQGITRTRGRSVHHINAGQ